ncbi:hypothetical protein EAF04_000655 [Stromatinia cepivora]|nr:hypothetical protein EAF04_000655 [Stromatinia cepivora]
MHRSRHHVFTFLSLWWSLGYAVADDHGVVFLYPPKNLTVNYLDTINVTYTSLFPEPELWIFCQNASDLTAPLITESQTTVKAYNGTAPINFRWLGGSPCWFDLKPNSSGGLGANSPHFTVEQTKRAMPITLGLDSATTSTTTSTTATSTPTTSSDGSAATTTAASSSTVSSDASSNTTSPNSAANSNSNNTPTGGLSGGAKAGIGIGIAIIALLALAAGFFFWRRKRQAKETDYTVYPSDVNMNEKMIAAVSSTDYSQIHPQEPVAFEMYAPEHKFEMPVSCPVGELSGDGYGKTRLT